MAGDIYYKRSRFATRLQTDRLYTASHYWVQQQSTGVWRIGLTKFAARMLGEIVDLGFEVVPQSDIAVGDAIGWLEGFKARTDLYAVAGGTFARGNPAFADSLELLDSDRYGAGWLYEVDGQPDAAAMTAEGYAALLDQTIDRMREQGY
jgi:glycine cleavage system H protein